jgi:hypothetical protein
MGNKASRIFKFAASTRAIDDPASDATQPDTTTPNRRYDSCTVLADAGIANAIWLEDALTLHGSNSMVWDLSLLVTDPTFASDYLCRVGYHPLPPDPRFDFDPEFSKRGIRLALPKNALICPSSQGGIDQDALDTDTAVTLLPAQDWYFDLGRDIDLRGPAPWAFRPPLSRLLDALMSFWLHLSSMDYTSRLRFSLYIGILISYCYQLTDDSHDHCSVRVVEYAQYLRPEHRELHYDIVASFDEDGVSKVGGRKMRRKNGKGAGEQGRRKMEDFTTVRRHQYHVRRWQEIQEGTFTPAPYEKGEDREGLAILEE